VGDSEDADFIVSPLSTVESSVGKVPLDFLEPSDSPMMLGMLGDYDIIEPIGCGGMGVVLKGYDSKLNRFVAVKVLAPHYATSAAARKRFAREAKAAAAVVHPHVLAIHSVDSTGRLPFLVMPFVDGESLQERVRRNGQLGTKEVLRIGIQAARGLQAAHEQGLVHRNIKPGNILLERDVERAMLTDFGLARAVDDASMTRSGVIAGTPQFMSPEQARGEAVDHRSDLFSLGSVLYTMCAGRPPFRAETTMGLLRRIIDVDPRPLPEVNADIPGLARGDRREVARKERGRSFRFSGRTCGPARRLPRSRSTADENAAAGFDTATGPRSEADATLEARRGCFTGHRRDRAGRYLSVPVGMVGSVSRPGGDRCRKWSGSGIG
jgi:serine/threonine protein kinase